MSRIKPDRVTPVASLDECDRALARIAEINRQLAAADAVMNRKFDVARAAAAEDSAPLKAELLQLTNGIEAFGESHKSELFSERERSKELAHGFIGFRLSSAISVSKKTLDLLKQAGKRLAIIVKESVDKDVLKTWTEAQLAEYKAKRVTTDKFWFEVKDEEVARSRS
jgi:phage host-nuclease inhibitor protein Gam